jgi:hypothetical protein
MLSNIPSNFLKIPSQDGSPINEYRIRHGQIQFRSLDSQGNPFPYTAGAWRTLDAGDLQMHFVLNTAVAQWLVARLGAKSGAGWKRPQVGPLDST